MSPISHYTQKMLCIVAELNAQFAESAKLKKTIEANLKGIGNGR